MKKKEKKPWREKMPWKLFQNKKTVLTVYFVLRALVILAMVHQIFLGNWENVFLCGLTLILFLMPSILERKFKVDLPDTLEIVILLFIFAADILGEIAEFYIRVPHWDTALHTINGFLFAAVGFAIVNMLNEDKRVAMRLSPVSVALVAFCFSMTIGVLWEFFECSMDLFFLLDMQKDSVVNQISTVMLDPTGGNTAVVIRDITDVIVVAGGEEISLGLGGFLDIGLLDTMKDLFVNLIGAVVFSIVGYFYVKSRGKGRFAGRFIPKVHSKVERFGDEPQK